MLLRRQGRTTLRAGRVRGYHSIVKSFRSRSAPPVPERLRPRRRLARALAAALAFAFAVQGSTAQNLPSLGDTERSELSPLMERRLGERIMSDLRRDKDYLDDAPLREYLNTLGGKLVGAKPESRGEAAYDYVFFAVRDPMLNAFAMPGGFIGVHTGLMLAAQTESELASVLSHEIGHVAQRHIARMIGGQKQDSLIPLAAMLLAALAARSSPDLANAAIVGGQGLAMQRQLNFSREAEREADRVGLQILREGGFDTSGMVAFFGRLQQSSRGYSDTAPAYLRTHPLTTERIADIQSRITNERYRQRADGSDFQLMRARARVLQDPSSQGLRDSVAYFETLLQQRSQLQSSVARYGLAVAALRAGDPQAAQQKLDELRNADRKLESSALASLAVEIALASRRGDDAVRLAAEAQKRYPLSRGIAAQYGDALLLAGRNEEAMRYLRDQVQLYRQEAAMQEKLARAFAAVGRIAQQHMALAEAHAINGSIPAALDQLGMARRARDATFFDQSVIDARERELRAQRMEELKDRGK